LPRLVPAKAPSHQPSTPRHPPARHAAVVKVARRVTPPHATRAATRSAHSLAAGVLPPRLAHRYFEPNARLKRGMRLRRHAPASNRPPTSSSAQPGYCRQNGYASVFVRRRRCREAMFQRMVEQSPGDGEACRTQLDTFNREAPSLSRRFQCGSGGSSAVACSRLRGGRPCPFKPSPPSSRAKQAQACLFI